MAVRSRCSFQLRLGRRLAHCQRSALTVVIWEFEDKWATFRGYQYATQKQHTTNGTTAIQSHCVLPIIIHKTLPTFLQSAQSSRPVPRCMRLLYIRYEILHFPRRYTLLVHLIQFCRVSFGHFREEEYGQDPNDGSKTKENEGSVVGVASKFGASIN